MTASNLGVTTPQFVSPFTLNADGSPVCVQQDSAQDIQYCVYNILVCPEGGKLGDPTFGAPPLLFQNVPLNTSRLLAQVQQLEPRANYQIVEGAASTVVQNLTIKVQPQAAYQQS